MIPRFDLVNLVFVGCRRRKEFLTERRIVEAKMKKFRVLVYKQVL